MIGGDDVDPRAFSRLRGSGMEYRRMDEVKALDRAILVPVNFPKAPALDNPDQEKSVELTDLLHWDFAPENPARLAKAGVTIALTSDGLKDKGQFLNRAEIARHWYTQEYVPVVRMLRAADLIGSRTEAEAYMRVAAERYRLILTHDWNDEVIERLRRTIR